MNKQIILRMYSVSRGGADATIKADGGAFGLTEEPSSLCRWMVAVPEISCLVSLYEIEAQSNETSEHTLRHEQTLQAQRTFLDSVNKLSQSLQHLDNPFHEKSQDLYSLDTKDIVHPNSSVLLHAHMERGQIKFQEFLQTLENNPATFYESVKRNKVDLFSGDSAPVTLSKQKHLKEDCSLFSKMFISCQSREGNLKEFFQHETRHSELHWVRVEGCTLAKISAYVSPWDSCHAIRPRTRGRCPYCGWFSFGIYLAT